MYSILKRNYLLFKFIGSLFYHRRVFGGAWALFMGVP